MQKILSSVSFLLLASACLVSSMAWAGGADRERLAAVLAAQPAEVQARYVWRHPEETLEFFGVAPGMTVVEALPGGGWYTKILLPYLGSQGRLIGADYSLEMYPLFGFFNEEQLKAKETWVKDFTAEATGWAGDDGAAVAAFAFGTMPDGLQGQADAVLFIRALHNLARFEKDGGFLTAALQNAHAALKPGGILGVVQHRAPDAMPDDWAGGQRGYLKQAWLIQRLEGPASSSSAPATSIRTSGINRARKTSSGGCRRASRPAGTIRTCERRWKPSASPTG